jgi:hypothetical protein
LKIWRVKHEKHGGEKKEKKKKEKDVIAKSEVGKLHTLPRERRFAETIPKR